LTAALAKGLSLSVEEAEKAKREIDLRDRSDPRSAILRECLEPWFFEVEKGLRLENTEGARLLLMAGAASLRGFSDYVEERLSVPKAEGETGPLGIDSPSLALGVGGLEKIGASSEGPLFPLALGLALRSDGPGEINFRKGEFAFGKALAEQRAKWTSVGLTLLIVIGLFFGNFYLRYQIKASRLEGLRTELRERFDKAFPGIRSAGPEVDQARAAIEALKRRGAFLGVGEFSPLVILREITTAIPREVPIEVQDLVIDEGKVRLEAQTDSFESIDRIKAALVKVPLFTEVAISDAKVGADPTKVAFRIQFRAEERPIR
jgi:hypothetical protein